MLIHFCQVNVNDENDSEKSSEPPAVLKELEETAIQHGFIGR